jgi:DNA modification methylase
VIYVPILNWIGKESVVNHDKEVPFRLLKKVKSLSFGENSQNLIIHGDNLEALKALMPYYQGQVKCIYIDPPYNTGNESWVYNDKVNSPKIKKWLGKVVGSESEDLCRHDKWLCMMYPRLKLLRDLLNDDGVILISIDDNELHNLKSIMDEIFNESNFKNIIVIRRGSKSVQAQFEKIDKLGVGAEYILLYSKNPTHRLDQFYTAREDSKEGTWNNHWRGTNRPTMRYELFGIKPEFGQWRWSRERSLRAINNYKEMLKDISKSNDTISQAEIDQWYLAKLEAGEDLDLLRLSSNKKPEHYIPPSDNKLGNSLWTDLLSGGSAELKKLFGDKVFDNPKTIELVKRIIKMATSDKNALILDSFAGSGTTGHAVLDLNKEDGGDRKFILVELEDKVAKEITTERIKRAIEKYSYKDGFEFCELDKPLFNEEGQIEQESSFEQLATYIYFTETNTNIDRNKISGSFIGDYDETEYHLIFKGKGQNILDKEFLKKLQKNNKRKVIYADKCLIDERALKKHKIQFKQIPYEVKVY